MDNPLGDEILLFNGVALIVVAILLNVNVYCIMKAGNIKASTKGLLLLIVAGQFSKILSLIWLFRETAVIPLLLSYLNDPINLIESQR